MGTPPCHQSHKRSVTLKPPNKDKDTWVGINERKHCWILQEHQIMYEATHTHTIPMYECRHVWQAYARSFNGTGNTPLTLHTGYTCMHVHTWMKCGKKNVAISYREGKYIKSFWVIWWLTNHESDTRRKDEGLHLLLPCLWSRRRKTTPHQPVPLHEENFHHLPPMVWCGRWVLVR